MTTKEAIQAMIDGKKVKRAHWAQGVYEYFESHCFYNQDNDVCNTFSDSSDWTFYEENNKQVLIIEKWLCKNIKEGSYFIFDIEKNKTILFFEKTKLLDTYEVEL